MKPRVTIRGCNACGEDYIPNVIHVCKRKVMRIVPLENRIIVKPAEAQDRSKGGIYIPDKAQERPMKGEVLDVGPGKRDTQGKLIPMSVKVGDVVLYGSFAGVDVEHDVEKYLLIREDDVLGRIVE